MTTFTNHQLIIFGLGREGLSTYRWLRQQFPQSGITLVDDASLNELDPQWTELVESDEQVSFTQANELSPSTTPALVFRSAGIPRQKVTRLLPTAEVTSNTQLFLEQVAAAQAQGQQIVVVGVTGTKGKSTTAAAIHHLLHSSQYHAFLGGNIGKPPLDIWAEAAATITSTQPTFLVVEFSSHQLSDVTHSPQIAVVQDIVPEHLDYYASFEAYWHAKSQIARFQTENDLILYNKDSHTATQIAQLSRGTQIGFGTDQVQTLLAPLVSLSELKVVGAHNYLNVLPAVLIGRHLRISDTQIASALKTFTPLPHRLEKVAEVNGVSFINDSLATTPQATMAALAAFDSVPVILIAGGYDRGLDYSDLGPAIQNGHIKALILFSPTGEKIAAAVTRASTSSDENAQNRVSIHRVETMTDAVTRSWEISSPGDIVLMSPASASFGTFKDYADRGEQFRQEVQKLER